MNNEFSAVTFGLYAVEELTAADGAVIPADGLIEILSLGENGKATLRSDVPCDLRLEHRLPPKR